jgi:hypothetical protein
VEGDLMQRVAAETVRRLATFDPGGLPVVSVYARVDADPGERALATHADSLLHQVRRHAARDGGLSHAARTSLKADERAIQDALTQQEWPAGTAAVVVCSGAGLREEVALSRTIRERAVVDATPWLRPMVAVLDEEHSACVVVVDRGSARVWALTDGTLRWSGGQRDPRTPRKPDFAGWHGLQEHSVQRRTEELARRHYRRVARQVRIACLASGCELLVVGGHREELPAFVEELPNDLRARVAGTFRVDPATATTDEVRGAAEELVERHEREEERRSVGRVLAIHGAHGPAAVGLEDCLWAGTLAAIASLLVEQDLEAPGVVCDHDAWMGTSGARCPLCGAPTRAVPDIVDELVEAVIEEGGTIVHVVAETPLRAHGAAASLRFPLPPRPDAPPS